MMDSRSSYWVVQPGRPGGTLLLVVGLWLVLFGVLIWLVPNLLEYLVATVFIAIGLLMVVAGWRWRRASRPARADETDIVDPW